MAVAAASFKTRLDHYLNIDDVANVHGCAGDLDSMKRKVQRPLLVAGSMKELFRKLVKHC